MLLASFHRVRAVYVNTGVQISLTKYPQLYQKQSLSNSLNEWHADCVRFMRPYKPSETKLLQLQSKKFTDSIGE